MILQINIYLMYIIKLKKLKINKIRIDSWKFGKINLILRVY